MTLLIQSYFVVPCRYAKGFTLIFRTASLAGLIAVTLSGCAGDFGSGVPDTQLRAQRDSVDKAFATAECSTLTTAIRADIAAMKAADENEQRERNAAPVTVARALIRLAGPAGAGDISAETLTRTNAHAGELNERLTAKGCPKIDIEAELHATEVKQWVPAAEPANY